MKQEMKMFIILNLFAVLVWGAAGAVYGAYQTLAGMNGVWAVAFWLLLITLLILGSAVQYYAFRALAHLLQALPKWIELCNFLGWPWRDPR